jgi:hypothetical protein
VEAINTENTKQIGSIKSTFNDANYVIDNNYNAKTTVKETTLAPTPYGRGYNSEMGNYTRDESDEARVTTKQTTIDQTYIGGVRSDIEAKMREVK